MARVLNFFENPSVALPEKLMTDVARLDGEELITLLCHVATKAILKLPTGCIISVDPVFMFAREMLSWSGSASLNHARPNSRTARIAELILSLPKDVTGPERALAAAVRLYHEGADEVNARSINGANDECKGAFIPNITTAIASNVRAGFLEETTRDGHSTFKVTAQGFASFEVLHRKLHDRVGNINEGKQVGNAA
ncbi:hypothetical protein [Prosthecobacter sp.]|uniref:hypothetical protein n=1 Tax=Prosthecobacter sp. TaxID=1965333 RepID=UPI00378405E6